MRIDLVDRRQGQGVIVLRAGVDEYPPIDITRLNWFLDDHADELTDDRRRALTATSEPLVVPIGFGLAEDIAEAERAAFQNAAITAESDFAVRTGYTLPGEIVIAYSQLGMLPGGLSAGAKTFEDPIDWDRYRGFFATDAGLEWAKELYQDATADGDLGCHQHAIHPGGPRAFFATPSPWLDEGYASWAGEYLAGGTDTSTQFWDLYHDGVGAVGGHNITGGAYDGIAPFSYLHDNGVDGFANFVS